MSHKHEYSAFLKSTHKDQIEILFKQIEEEQIPIRDGMRQIFLLLNTDDCTIHDINRMNVLRSTIVQKLEQISMVANLLNKNPPE